MRTLVRNTLAIALLLAARSAAAAVEPLPMPGPLETLTPVAGQHARPQFVTPVDDRALQPEAGHPPFGEIPPMPMPERGDWRPPAVADDRVVVHDAKLGTTAVWPLAMPSGDSRGRSPEANYRGLGPSDDTPVLQGFGSMTVANDLPGWPRRGNVKMFMRFTTTGGTVVWYTCSGSMADAGVVQTAAHCVYARNPNGNNIYDWADEIWVYPAWDGVGTEWAAPGSTEVIRHFGYLRGSFYMAGSDYVNNGNFDRDLGAVRIDRGSSRMAGMLTGWFGWAWGGDCATIQARAYYNFSYPAENCGGGLHTGRTMYYWDGSWDSCPSNQLVVNTTAGCLTAVWGGMSGSGAYYIDGDNRYVHAACSNSDRSTYGAWAKLWESWVTDRTTFTNDTRTGTLDLEALQFRAQGSTTVTAGTTMDANSLVYIANATNANPASNSYTLRVYLSSNNIISGGDTLLATWFYTVDLAAMQGINFQVPAIQIPVATAGGTWWLGGILDPATDGIASNNDSSVWDAQQITVRAQNLFRNGFE